MDQSQGQGRDLLYVQDLASIRRGTQRFHSIKEIAPKNPNMHDLLYNVMKRICEFFAMYIFAPKS